MTPVQDLIRSREAAEILNIDVRTVARWVQEGKLEVAVKVPGYRGAMLFDRAVVHALADYNASGATTEPDQVAM